MKVSSFQMIDGVHKDKMAAYSRILTPWLMGNIQVWIKVVDRG